MEKYIKWKCEIDKTEEYIISSAKINFRPEENYKQSFKSLSKECQEIRFRKLSKDIDHKLPYNMRVWWTSLGIMWVNRNECAGQVIQGNWQFTDIGEEEYLLRKNSPISRNHHE